MHDNNDVDESSPKPKPEAVKYCNKTKDTVDTLDHMRYSISTIRKTRRWPMLIFYNLLDTVAIAAFVSYKEIFQDGKLVIN
ncbi:PiggyBac transposable element-derived 3-like protein [Plakobranchus ocellatus]|uniref:PiggyBac transposable element-derived 3-like protein n=1 Tax=Plakobranchus ocellatus TaxID=259542 RepID=A0AAV3YDR3_9GAST|nr:PiggyBac transposable element-derived 3-like protein [Plakobranchus ocellatus]